MAQPNRPQHVEEGCVIVEVELEYKAKHRELEQQQPRTAREQVPPQFARRTSAL
jgi:hypothetical protein